MWKAHQKSGKHSSYVTHKKNEPILKKRKQLLKKKVNNMNVSIILPSCIIVAPVMEVEMSRPRMVRIHKSK